jgi:hypothetical protein
MQVCNGARFCICIPIANISQPAFGIGQVNYEGGICQGKFRQTQTISLKNGHDVKWNYLSYPKGKR